MDRASSVLSPERPTGQRSGVRCALEDLFDHVLNSLDTDGIMVMPDAPAPSSPEALEAFRPLAGAARYNFHV